MVVLARAETDTAQPLSRWPGSGLLDSRHPVILILILSPRHPSPHTHPSPSIRLTSESKYETPVGVGGRGVRWEGEDRGVIFRSRGGKPLVNRGAVCIFCSILHMHIISRSKNNMLGLRRPPLTRLKPSSHFSYDIAFR
ncbi:hypothetical protein J6590_020854 [Homalodisca vitripennis]|nr:hypothetical protein J6590_020854 [Homalodisca vitripennis]